VEWNVRVRLQNGRMTFHCTLRIHDPGGTEERPATFFAGMPALGRRVTLEGRELEITGAGVVSGYALVVATVLA
jgi:hypothetical protein